MEPLFSWATPAVRSFPGSLLYLTHVLYVHVTLSTPFKISVICCHVRKYVQRYFAKEISIVCPVMMPQEFTLWLFQTQSLLEFKSTRTKHNLMLIFFSASVGELTKFLLHYKCMNYVFLLRGINMCELVDFPVNCSILR